VGEDIQKGTLDWKGLRVTVKLTVINRVATVGLHVVCFCVSVVGSCALSSWPPGGVGEGMQGLPCGVLTGRPCPCLPALTPTPSGVRGCMIHRGHFTRCICAVVVTGLRRWRLCHPRPR
jgi:hypothetical protein